MRLQSEASDKCRRGEQCLPYYFIDIVAAVTRRFSTKSLFLTLIVLKRILHAVRLNWRHKLY